MKSTKHGLPGALLVVYLLGMSFSLQAQEVVRHHYDSGPQIAAAVEVPADATLVFLGGTVPQVNYPEGSALPDDATYTQSLTVFESLQQRLADLDLTLGDVVQMQVFLVGVPQQDERLDFQGFTRAYEAYFGTDAQPNLPVRSVLQVAGLARPDWVVEVEVTAVRP